MTTIALPVRHTTRRRPVAVVEPAPVAAHDIDVIRLAFDAVHPTGLACWCCARSLPMPCYASDASKWTGGRNSIHNVITTAWCNDCTDHCPEVAPQGWPMRTALEIGTRVMNADSKLDAPVESCCVAH